ncbi:rapunzel 2 [Tachysurus fulvidraco]|uniref:rapunzel 2 n=1 Tax=Tachysurus fulvidraco TaxID=1234273 RepID=UPI001FEFA020|nr:rapunzel 2 [Tachysurus fulvidraco]
MRPLNQLGIAGKKKYSRGLDFGEEGSSLKRTTGDQRLSRGKARDPLASMADKEQIKKNAAKVLGYVEKVSSFASSIDPLFGIVTSLVGVVRKGLVEDETHELDKDFKKIHDKLESISQQNKQTLQQIRLNEVNEAFDKYEEYIKHQYCAFNTMVERVRTNPDDASRYMEDFKNVYEKDKSDLSLDVFYRGVIGKNTVFGRPLLIVYLEHCERDRRIMQARCAHLAHLFQIGLMALMAYYAVTEDDEDEIREKWAQRVIDIQTKMQEALDECSEQE